MQTRPLPKSVRATAAVLTLALVQLPAWSVPANAARSVPPVGQTPNDPVGDTAGIGPDIVALSVQRSSTEHPSQLDLRLRLAAPPADPGAIFGFIDLDADADATTGGQSSVDFLTRGSRRPLASSEPIGFGSDLRLDLAGWAAIDPTLDLVDEVSGAILGRVPATWEGAELRILIDETLRPGIASGPLRATATVGTAHSLTDFVPNRGHVSSEDPEGTELRAGRFVVAVSWRDFQGNQGEGTVVTKSEDSALFWFFESSNWELLVKVLDGCAINQHLWLFSAATTDVEFTVRVHDRETGLERTYFNPLGTAAPAINDTEAFASCAQ